jgi:hypothetical protein
MSKVIDFLLHEGTLGKFEAKTMLMKASKDLL